MSNPIHSIYLQIIDERHAGHIIACCKAQELEWKFKDRKSVIEVFSDDPVQFYYLGANVVALGAGFFEGPLTTQK